MDRRLSGVTKLLPIFAITIVLTAFATMLFNINFAETEEARKTVIKFIAYLPYLFYASAYGLCLHVYAIGVDANNRGFKVTAILAVVLLTMSILT